jgi:hypothetical protein
MPGINFVGASYESISPNYSQQTTINLYPVMSRTVDQTKYQSALFSTPGKSLFVDLGGFSVRRVYATTSMLYAIVDSNFYQITTSGVATLLGNLVTNTGLCQITSNFTQIGIVDGTNNLYVYDIPSLTFSANAIPNNATASSITMQDSYGIFTLDNSIYFQITTAGDFRSMDILQEAGISSASQQNKLVTVASHSLELWLLGTTRTEVWRNLGTSPFTYGRAEGIFIEVGCSAVDSVQVMDNSIIWLSHDERGQALVYRGNGYTPVVISTEPLHRIFASYSTVSDAKSFSYAEDGHLFYVLTFPIADATWVYDCTTSLWHRRTSWNPASYRTTRDLSNGYGFFNGKHIVGDVSSGKLYISSTAIYAEGANPIYRERTFPTLDSDLNYMTCRNIQIDVQSGVGLATGQGSDPQVNLQSQKDGIWGTIIPRSAGKIGERNKRVRWNKQEIARNWVFRVTMTDPVSWSLLSAVANFEIGDQ